MQRCPLRSSASRTICCICLTLLGGHAALPPGASAREAAGRGGGRASAADERESQSRLGQQLAQVSSPGLRRRPFRPIPALRDHCTPRSPHSSSHPARCPVLARLARPVAGPKDDPHNRSVAPEFGLPENTHHVTPLCSIDPVQAGFHNRSGGLSHLKQQQAEGDASSAANPFGSAAKDTRACGSLRACELSLLAEGLLGLVRARRGVDMARSDSAYVVSMRCFASLCAAAAQAMRPSDAMALAMGGPAAASRTADSTGQREVGADFVCLPPVVALTPCYTSA